MYFRRTAAFGTAILAGALVLSACGQDSGSGSSSDPIKIGSVSGLTGPASYPDVVAAAQAVFDRVNAEGGINGRKIEYIVQDDKGDPAAASQAARQLVDDDEVVANVGSASLVDCSANTAYYAKSGVLSIQAVGVDPACFSTPSISPVNTGPFEGYTALLYYASETMKHQKVCAIILGLPGLTEGYQKAVDRWSSLTGKTAALVDTSVKFGDDPTPAILAAKSAGCEAVVFNATEPVTLNIMKSVQQQGLLDGVDWLTIASSYTDAELDGLVKQGTPGLYVNAEFYPYTEDSPALADWRKLLTDAKVPLTSLSQGGYLSALIAVDTLKKIDGDITRESVTEALHSLDSWENDMLGMPYSFGTADAHNPNRASKIVQATNDGWTVVTPDWQKLPS
ncbi:MAG TPA: ABC transporter substrate-binding protein [Mycobacterium sp.]|nr:ABC transporter substrate-binding protein [Mycobacterium sp.]